MPRFIFENEVGELWSLEQNTEFIDGFLIIANLVRRQYFDDGYYFRVEEDDEVPELTDRPFYKMSCSMRHLGQENH